LTPIVAVIAPGLMGAAVGKRLVDNGLKVLTSLEGRSLETAARAKTAGLVPASDEEIVSVDFILSILPPAQALSLAKRFVPTLSASKRKPVYVDCNAINPATLEHVAAAIAPTECPFVDAGIIGGPPANPPPQAGDGSARISGPRFYACGAEAPRFAALRDYGLDVRVLGGALGAARASLARAEQLQAEMTEKKEAESAREEEGEDEAASRPEMRLPIVQLGHTAPMRMPLGDLTNAVLATRFERQLAHILWTGREEKD